MLLCIDESGSINNHSESQEYFVVAVVHVKSKGALKRKYDKFVKTYMERLKELDKPRYNAAGEEIREGNKMFNSEGQFIELKGCQFDRQMKYDLVDFFITSQAFEIYYIKIVNSKLTDKHCANKERVFNYSLKLALTYFISKGKLPKDEDLHINLDNRNIKTDAKMSLDEYLNTELHGGSILTGNVSTTYFESHKSKLIQIADVFSNLYFSHLYTDNYSEKINALIDAKIIKGEFVFPL